jgi:uncharacterized protein YneF (UPF0154 family)
MLLLILSKLVLNFLDSIILMILLVPVVILVGLLVGFHTILIKNNVTTYERVRMIY